MSALENCKLPDSVLANGWTLQENVQYAHMVHEVVDADINIQWHIRHTQLEPSHWLSKQTGCAVKLKLESEQHTGSFKARGALHKVLSLDAQRIQQGVVTSSTGNHALGFLYACRVAAELQQQQQQQQEVQQQQEAQQQQDAQQQAPQQHATQAQRAAPHRIYVPHTASAYKVSKLESLGGAQLVRVGQDCVEAEAAAAQAARAEGLTYISPYNDLQVIGGQGTVALELLRDIKCGQLDFVFIPVGGGGLISGMAVLLKAVDPSICIVGCQPAASDVMRRSVLAGHIVDELTEESSGPGTLSDGTAGGVEADAMTLGPCIHCVDEWVAVSEQEIAQAMVGMLQHHSKLVEGAAGCAVAGLLRMRDRIQGKNAVVVCCGGNVSLPVLRHVLAVID